MHVQGKVQSLDPKHSDLFVVVQTCKLKDRRCVYRTIPQDILHNIACVFDNFKRKCRIISYSLSKTALDYL